MTRQTVWARSEYREVLVRRRRFRCRRSGAAVARGHGVLRGVPRFALLPRVASDEDRAGQPGDDPELPWRACPWPAEEILMTNYFDLTGRSALVTGAAGGIGSAVAQALAEAGAAVLVTDLDKDAAAVVAERISAD